MHRIDFTRLLGALVAWICAATALSAAVPTITNLTSPNQSVSFGGSKTFTVTATGTPTPLSYQWKRKGKNLSNGNGIAGATTASLTISGATPLRDNGWYQVAVSNSDGTVTSSAVFLNVILNPTVIEVWGTDTHGETFTPPDLNSLFSVACGYNFSLALKSDGTVEGWGRDDSGQIDIPFDLANVVAISARISHSLALKADGTVVGWPTSQAAAQVPSALQNAATAKVVAIAAGGGFSLALKSDGTVVGWPTGVGIAAAEVPSALKTAATANVVAISAGHGHSIALKSDGTVVTWGDDTYHQVTLPSGINTNQDIVGVAGGGYHTAVLKSNGTVVTWGGLSSSGPGARPVPPSATGIVALTAIYRNFAIKSDGTMVVWDQETAALDATMPTRLQSMHACMVNGYYHAMALPDPNYAWLAVQPENTGVTSGQSTAFSISAIGTSPTYQWQLNSDVSQYRDAFWADVSVNSIYSNVQTGQLNLNTTNTSMSGYRYRCRVSNSLGTVYSDSKLLTVNPLRPSDTDNGGGFTIQPPLTRTVLQNGTTSFTVAANADPAASYQWQKKAPADADFSDLVSSATLVGAATATLTIVNAPTSLSGYQFRCIAYNDGAADESFEDAVSDAVTLTVTPLTPVNFSLSAMTFTYNGAAQGPTVIASVGGATFTTGGTLSATNVGSYVGTATATGAYTGSNNSLNWSIIKANQSAPAALTSSATTGFNSGYIATVASGFGAVTWSLGAGSTASGAAINATTGAISTTGLGTVVVRAAYAGDSNHNASGLSSNFTITVNKGTPAITWPAPAPITVGTPLGATQLNATTNVAGTFVYNPAAGTILNEGARTLSTTFTPTDTTKYDIVTVQRSLMVVAPNFPVITQQPGNLVVNVGQSATFTVAASANPAPNYQWRRNGINIAGATGATLTINTVAAIHAGSYTVVVSNSNGSITSNTVTLTVQTESSIWLMNGTAFKFGVSLGYRDSNWQLVTAADFNGDNKPDILLQNVVTGERQIQLLDGASQTSTVSLGILDPNWQMVAAVDFNGDHKPDIVLQNTVTGQRALWLMNGTTYSSSLDLGTYDLSWRIATAADFDGDGKADLLWQNTITGECTIWLMNGTQFVYGVNLGTYDLKWRMAAVADFDGDGKVDIIWQDAITGQRNLWLMNGTQFVFGVDLGTYDLSWRIVAVADFDHDGKKDILWQSMSFGQTGTADLGIVDPNWKMVGTGDFNGDHNPDVVWQNLATGQRAIWLMNGSAFSYSADLGTVDINWQIAAIADFNHDGKSDLVWQNVSTGQRTIWLMNGTTFGSAVSLGVVDPNWRIATAADFNGDGNPDIVWQNLITGQRAMWLMNGAAYFFGIDLGNVDTNWKISAAADFTGDGKPDLLWQNTTTGQATVWRMNGVLGITPLDFGTYDLNLQCVGAADFDHRGGPDLLWQNTVTGQRSISFISGSGY